ncbi:hypothetical protein VDF74_06515 [Xanthomonas campestris pv. raphani]|uniref:hypothetical protein n=1 Tax=Xanthomonas campestris TaxID=339 RepID=UPI002B2291A1|nr:hypothetical protein [Xanthomonas campestris]MEA9738643.1 hypothetical protein [Xanthomonas campestris pv. raphani]
METLKWAFARCWPLSAACEINWDAWAVVIAVGALLASALSVLITGVSAYAVFWLGKQANRLARTTYDIEQAARAREAKFILGYLYAEVLYNHACIIDWLSKADFYEKELLLFDQNQIQGMLDVLGELHLPQTEALFGRLHVVDQTIGARLARAVSMLQLVRGARWKVRDASSDAERKKQFDRLRRQAESVVIDLATIMRAGEQAQNLV